MPLSAVISAGASLIGGLLGKKSEDKQQKRQMAFAREEREYNKPINIRARAEEGGFNPLLFIGPGVGNAASGGISGGGSNYMGQAIADAGMLIAEGMRNKSAETKRINELETQNKELQKKLVDQTIRPRIGGIYQSGGPTIRKPVSPETSAQAFSPVGASVFANTLANGAVVQDGLFSGYTVEHEPLKVMPGGTMIKNRMTGDEGVWMPEDTGLDEMAGAAAIGGSQLAYRELSRRSQDARRDPRHMVDYWLPFMGYNPWIGLDMNADRAKPPKKRPDRPFFDDPHERRFIGGYKLPRPF